MYQGQSVNREEYLLGRKIDDKIAPPEKDSLAVRLSSTCPTALSLSLSPSKAFVLLSRSRSNSAFPFPFPFSLIPLLLISLARTCVSIQVGASQPGATFADGAEANSARDMARKVRDDPLFFMKKKEHEVVKDTLSNPLRLKQIQAVRPCKLCHSRPGTCVMGPSLDPPHLFPDFCLCLLSLNTTLLYDVVEGAVGEQQEETQASGSRAPQAQTSQFR